MVMEIYTIKKHIRGINNSVGPYVGTLLVAYKNKEMAIEKKDALNDKSHNYIYKVSKLDLI